MFHLFKSTGFSFWSQEEAHCCSVGWWDPPAREFFIRLQSPRSPSLTQSFRIFNDALDLSFFFFISSHFHHFFFKFWTLQLEMGDESIDLMMNNHSSLIPVDWLHAHRTPDQYLLKLCSWIKLIGLIRYTFIYHYYLLSRSLPLSYFLSFSIFQFFNSSIRHLEE